MIRIIIFLAALALVALGLTWVADRPGEVAVTWQGWRIETSIMVAAVSLAVSVAICMLIWTFARTLWRSPQAFARYRERRRSDRGNRAISRGLIAVGAGDLRTAKKFAAEAKRLKSAEPLALLLSAQTAQLAGDRAGAELAFRAMAEHPDTKLLGLRGLFVEARRREDAVAARGFAEEAVREGPALGWAAQAALEFRVASGDFDGALLALDSNMKHKLIDRGAYRRQRAVLLTASALALEETDRERAREQALEAVRLAPTLVPAAEVAARRLLETGKLRRAARLLERAWQANPHPDLAHLYSYLRFGDSPRDRLARVEKLAGKTPDHPEAAIAMARAAIDAREFGLARLALNPLVSQPTQRVAELMAELEHAESGNEGRTREWMARALKAARDPAWTADGFVSDRWLPMSPVTGRIDAFEWKVPLAALGGEAPVIDNEQPAEEPASARSLSPATDTARASETSVRSIAPAGGASDAGGESPDDKRGAWSHAVIPLVHAPDDPGPERPSESAEHAARAEPSSDTWWPRRLFRLG